ncbi:MAG: penicillin-binding transpeptidase domain-containing protein [Desulfocapsaceae bacterium]|nr:penicillin-binding transpeptidase domain-containing protein [Desulfocapsaceae bacterium]
MVIQSRRRGKKSGRSGLAFLGIALIVVAGVVAGAALYRQAVAPAPSLAPSTLDHPWSALTGFVYKIFSGQEKATDKKKNVRGTIYDRSFKELALSLDRVSLYVRPRELEDVHGSAGQLATVLGLDEQELLARLDKDSQRIWLAKDISLEEEKAVADLHLSGVFLHREQVRYYPYKSIAAHVIGFADRNMGLAGVERYYNRLLDQASISRDDFPQIDLAGHYKTGISGQHLVLTIDLKIQEFLEKYVTALGAVHEDAEIVALLMETETGAIVANANFPSFDPNLFYQYKKQNFANILLEPVVIPSGISKLFHDSALLQADWRQGKQSYPWSITAGSSDSGSELRLWQQLGLSAAPDLDFSMQDIHPDVGGIGRKAVVPESGTGTVPSTATPIQILIGLNSLLNGGHQVLPHVLDRIMERNGAREYFFRSFAAGDGQGGPDGAGTRDEGIGEEHGQVLQPALAETWSLLKAQGQKGVLDSVFVDVPDLSLQPVGKNSEYLRTRMMFALLPADKPELILMVMVRQPYLEPSIDSAKDVFDLVGPAGKILPSMVALQQVHKNLSDMMSKSERKETNYQQEQKKKKPVGLETMLELHHPLMPDLSGMSLRRALHLLQDKKLKVRIQGTGRVVAQSPTAGISLGGVKECLLTLKKDEQAGNHVAGKKKSTSESNIKNKIELIKGALRK